MESSTISGLHDIDSASRKAEEEGEENLGMSVFTCSSFLPHSLDESNTGNSSLLVMSLQMFNHSFCY